MAVHGGDLREIPVWTALVQMCPRKAPASTLTSASQLRGGLLCWFGDERPRALCLSSSQKEQKKLKSWFLEPKQREHVSPWGVWWQLDYHTFYQEQNCSTLVLQVRKLRPSQKKKHAIR